MDELKLLIVEDEKDDLKACQDSVELYQDEHQCKVELVECRDLKEAFGKLDNSFDGAIIDLNLGQGHEGNQVLSRIKESCFRIPVFIMTGTPDAVESDDICIEVCKKGEVRYADLLDRFCDIHRAGLERITGGKNTIETYLSKVFRENLRPQLNTWSTYGEKDPSRTEKALLRHTLNHLLQLLDDGGGKCFPEEMYLYPPLIDKILTGSIVRKKDSEQWFVVMSPACDLVIRNKKRKTDRILVIEIEPYSALFPDCPDISSISKTKQNELKNALSNKTPCYHGLPKTGFFDGGLLNFRKLTSLSEKEFDEQFKKSEIQIAPSFVKDIVARFSAYYARQGQPDIEFEQYIPMSEDKAANLS